MADALDVPGNIGRAEEFEELIVELTLSEEFVFDLQDPCAIVIRCEEIDEEEGRPKGTTLQLYYQYLKNS